MKIEDYNVEIPQNGETWEGMGALGTTPIVNAENYRIMIESLCAFDERSKSNWDVRNDDKPLGYEWYDESKHQDMLVKVMTGCLLNGDILDVTTHFDNEMNHVHTIFGNPIINIKDADYKALWDKANIRAEEIWIDIIEQRGTLTRMQGTTAIRYPAQVKIK